MLLVVWVYLVSFPVAAQGPQSPTQTQTQQTSACPFSLKQLDSCRIIFDLFWVFKLMFFTLFSKLFSIGFYQGPRPSIFRTDQQHRGKPVLKGVCFLKLATVPKSVLSGFGRAFVWIVLLTVGDVFEVKNPD